MSALSFSRPVILGKEMWWVSMESRRSLLSHRTPTCGTKMDLVVKVRYAVILVSSPWGVLLCWNDKVFRLLLCVWI